MPESEPKPKPQEAVTPGSGQGWKALLRNGKQVVVHEIPVAPAAATAAVPRIQRLAEHPHPSLSPILAWGTEASDIWVAVEPNEGTPLSSVLARGRFTPHAAAALGTSLLSGIAALHEAGVAMGGFDASAIRITGNGEVRLAGHPVAAVRGVPSQGDLRADVRSCGMAICAAFGVDPSGAPAPPELPPGLVVTMRSMASGAMGPAVDRAQGALREMVGPLLAPDRQMAAQSELALRAGGREMPSITPFVPEPAKPVAPPPVVEETPAPRAVSYDAPSRPVDTYAPLPRPTETYSPPSAYQSAVTPPPPVEPPAPAPTPEPPPAAPQPDVPSGGEARPWEIAPAAAGAAAIAASEFASAPPTPAPPAASKFASTPPSPAAPAPVEPASPFEPAAQQEPPPFFGGPAPEPEPVAPYQAPQPTPAPLPRPESETGSGTAAWTPLQTGEWTPGPAAPRVSSSEWTGEATPVPAPVPAEFRSNPPESRAATITTPPRAAAPAPARRPVEKRPAGPGLLSERPGWLIPAAIAVILLLLFGGVGAYLLSHRGSTNTIATASPHPSPTAKKASPTPTNLLQQVPVYAPAAAAPVTSVVIDPANSNCQLGSPCKLEVDIKFSSAQRTNVSMILKYFDRCTGTTTDFSGGSFTPPGYTLVIFDRTITLPAGSKSGAVVAVTQTPAAAASTPLTLGADSC